jgi:3-hydroxyacyl-CoA dehydrogenase/3-hydroxy-2-methylbutyryl-CoA dehydrogenase
VKVQGSVSLVTGGASGLGAGVARMLVERGGRVAVMDLPSSAGAEWCNRLGPSATWVPADVTEPDSVSAGVGDVVATYGRIDVLVSCAGIIPAARLLGRDGTLFPLSTFSQTLNVNLVGAFDVVRHSARRMAVNPPGADGERGLIVLVSSVAGIEGQVGQAAYAASKGGLIALTLPLARELGEVGIRVVTLCPGTMDTPMLGRIKAEVREGLVNLQVFPKRLGTPADLAGMVCAVIETPLLNGEVIRLDAAARLPAG